MEYCFVCEKRIATDWHHLIGGHGKRDLSDKNRLIKPVCRECHTFIHNNASAEHLCKMLGQALYEQEKLKEGVSHKDAREYFRREFGRNYLGNI